MDVKPKPPAIGCGARRRRGRDATMCALLNAGEKVFATRGYDAATTREVALAAGANEQLIQRYFGGKAGLLRAILDRFDTGDVEACCAAPPPAETVEAEIRNFLDFHLKRPGASGAGCQLALDRAMVDVDVAADLRRHLKETRTAFIRARLERLRALGRIDPAADLATVAAALTALTIGLGMLGPLVLDPADPPPAAIAASAADAFACSLEPKKGR